MATTAAVRGFARSDSDALHVWSPPRSPVRIEYARDLLRALVRRSGDADSLGVLYGERRAGTMRVIALHHITGLEPLGIFAARARGEVFLTEDDMARLDGLGSAQAIALVVAGDKGGFFVREPSGAMQTIKSYQEFRVRTLPKKARAAERWVLLALASAVAIALLIRPAPPLEIQAQDGELRIRLHRSDAKDGARLQIVDGEERRSIPITRSLSSVVYTPVTGDVYISVTH